MESMDGDASGKEWPIHVKPKKYPETMIQPADYISTPADDEVINLVKETPEDWILVEFAAKTAVVRRRHLECLFHHFGKKGYVNCEVVNAYITLLRAVHNFRTRKGGSVFLETSFVPPQMQHDGDEKVVMEAMYPDVGVSSDKHHE